MVEVGVGDQLVGDGLAGERAEQRVDMRVDRRSGIDDRDLAVPHDVGPGAVEGVRSGVAGDDAADGEGPSGPSRQQRRVDRRARREADESRHVDRILEKIADTGLESLTGREKRLLRRVTQRKQRAQ